MESTISNFSHFKIPLEEVLKATNNFDEINCIGKGELGKVYKGKLWRLGKWVKIAARRLDDTKHNHGKRNHHIGLLREISALSSLKHENIVSIIGFCDENGEKVIINKLEAKRSLEMYLSKPTLTWVQRVKICVGVARALSYIHFEEGRNYSVIHCNINSSTILLDDKFEPKLSGFEFSVNHTVHRMDQVYLREAIGTEGYIDPAILKTGGVTHKSDIYSFGVVLWEILFMRKAYIPNVFDRFLAPLARFHYETGTLMDAMEPSFYNQIGIMSMRTLIAYSCSNDDRAQRPDMNSIVIELEKALELQQQYESLYLIHVKEWSKFEVGIEVFKSGGSANQITGWRPNLEQLTCQHSHLKIRLEDISLATDKFSETYLYQETMFYKVYRAELELEHRDKKNKTEGHKIRTIVFIKRLKLREDKRGEEVFSTEIEILTTCKHQNIVTLLGYCDEYPEKIIVFEAAAHGYLVQYLGNYKDKSILTWEKRLKICLEVAYGLKYLHHEMDEQKTVISGYFSTFSIFLYENLRAKIGDFGHLMFLHPNQDSHNYDLLHGIRLYVDPEYLESGKLTRESDVYTFGIILFEILCGRMAYDEMYMKESEDGLVYVARKCFRNGTLMEIIDPIIKESSEDNNLVINNGPNKDSLDTFTAIAYRCLAATQGRRPIWEDAEIQDRRPTMMVVVEELEKALSFQEQVQLQEYSDQVVDGLELTNDNSENNALESPTWNYMKGNLLEHLHIRLSDIRLATNNFSKPCGDIYDGTCLFYKAKLEHFDQEKFASIKEKNRSELPKKRSSVLIKRLREENKERKELLLNEMEKLTTCTHPNIVTLLGFCLEDFEVILVFEEPYEFLGYSLYNKDNSIRTWSKRLRICLDVANALKYLHHEKMILLGNILSVDIFLDENFRAKISNFGYSLFLGRTPKFYFNKQLLLSVHYYYLDPIFCVVGEFKRETDVYSLGVLLFVIACGRFATDEIYKSYNGLVYAARRCFQNGTLMEMIDPRIMEETCENNFTLYGGPNAKSLDAFLKIAFACVEIPQDKRPTIKVVVEELEKALSYQENHKDPMGISLGDIKLATENFHTKHCVGQGGFGKVYKGKLLQSDHTIVAKLLDVRGYCADNDAKIIVYEYASRGSLDRYLNDSCLTWTTRLNICIDVATALDFLHRGVGKQATVIHRDIKTANILLDDDWHAKLADFGLSLISAIDKETDYAIDNVCGTKGYVDPVYLKSGFLTKESDIYSFGVVLFEILGGRSEFLIYKQEGVSLPSFVKQGFDKGKLDEMVFEKIKTLVVPEALIVFYTIAYSCLHENREARPTAEVVVEQLKKAMELQGERHESPPHTMPPYHSTEHIPITYVRYMPKYSTPYQTTFTKMTSLTERRTLTPLSACEYLDKFGIDVGEPTSVETPLQKGRAFHASSP
ncbi:uncharacterized protein [Rutidosis leptorrhynchoides]|uniref:uncharacterized protein n=1 Tax=Rutidosis leptorrhynchoides TaxID=125765 RepID=UPI003A997EA9